MSSKKLKVTHAARVAAADASPGRRMELSEQQAAFITGVLEGKSPTVSARSAGYKHPGPAAYTLMRNSRILAALRLERQALYQGPLASLAASTLESVMKDSDAPPAARVSAARTVLELAGDLGRREAEGEVKQLSELSPAELSQMISRWEEERSQIKDVTPKSTSGAQSDAEAIDLSGD
jgi:hypothetical protein